MTKQNAPSRHVRFAELAYRAAEASYPKYRRKKSKKTFSQPQLIACVLLKLYLNLSYRDCEEWLRATDRVCQALELSEVPDHSTLNRTFQRLTEIRLHKLLSSVLADLDVKESVIAGDSTGYTLSTASAYYCTLSGKTFRGWLKGSYAVGTQSQLILVARASRRHRANDAHMLAPVRDGARKYACGDDWVFLADAGFDCQAVTDRDIVPPIRRGGRFWLLLNARRAPTWSRKHAWMACSDNAGRRKRFIRSSNASSAVTSARGAKIVRTASRLSKPWSTTSIAEVSLATPMIVTKQLVLV